jgi:hypothetical protein
VKIYQGKDGIRELSDTNLSDDAVITLKSDCSVNDALIIQEEIVSKTEGNTTIVNALSMVTYIDVTGWNESKQQFIRIYVPYNLAGEPFEKSNDKVIQTVQLALRYIDDDLVEKPYGYIKSFEIVSYKDKCFISFSRYNTETDENGNIIVKTEIVNGKEEAILNFYK